MSKVDNDFANVFKLVETIPTGMEDLNKTVQLHTHTVLINEINSATTSLDFAIMYWSLLPEACGWKQEKGEGRLLDQKSTMPDCAGFTDNQMNDTFLAYRGKLVYNALVGALKRGVQVRVLQSAGFASENVSSVPNSESAALAKQFPNDFSVQTLNMSSWYGEGIQHTKFMIADRNTVFIGSSNFMDFRSLSLVKELGALIKQAPAIAADLEAFFDDAWAISALHPRENSSLLAQLYDASALRMRPVPRWSPLLPPTVTANSPLPISEPSSWQHPIKVNLDDAHAYVITGPRLLMHVIALCMGLYCAWDCAMHGMHYACDCTMHAMHYACDCTMLCI